MTFAKKLRQIVVFFFLIISVSSCEEGCYESDEYSAELYSLQSNPKIDPKSSQSIYGKYNNYDGGQVSDWLDTGLLANGDYFLIAISGGWISNHNSNSSLDVPPCSICIKKTLDQKNCFCGPRLENGIFTPEVSPEKELNTESGATNNSDCTAGSEDNPDICTCKKYGGDIKDLQKEGFFVYPLGSVNKTLEGNAGNFTYKPKIASDQKVCQVNMGIGAYIALWGIEGNSVPKRAYHLFTTDKYCPASILKDNGACLDENNNDKTRFLYRSPSNKIFVKDDSLDANDPNRYHQVGEVVKLIMYDQYYDDNYGSYKIEFLSGVTKKDGSGLIADIVKTMDEYLFGSNYYDKNIGARVKKLGVVEFMYKAVLQDNVVSRVISISLVMYVCFYGLGFFMGVVDFGRKEVSLRLIKIGLVILFTNKVAWQSYNDLVVGFFKSGMETIVNIVTSIFETKMERSLSSIMANEVTNIGVATKFIFIDNMIKDFISKANVARIFGLLVLPNGKGFFALILIPAIFALIVYFIYVMLDVALKYLINLFKICIGLALGPVFILFSLFEKTKDMFKNWLSFLSSRAMEIIFLLVMIHPFLLIIDNSFRMMMGYKVCTHNIGNQVIKFLVYKAEGGIENRTLFQWFEYILRIAALIFITKSIANKSAYIAGQIISVGGVANADPVSEVGHGQTGFSMGSAIAKGIMAGAKGIIKSNFIAGNLKYGARLAVSGLTKVGRYEFGRAGSINDMVNNAFKSVGIRNRGLRSYMRDREVDKAINLASLKADREGLVGKDRDNFIRSEAMSSLNLFRFSNKNHSAILGLDNKNILKRMDQKLVKQPLKNHIKEKAEELKSQGIIGKEARKIIRDDAKNWAKANLGGGDSERKVADFFKKDSMKNFLRSNVEMSSREAVEYSKILLNDGKVDEAKDFVDKFTENSVKNAMRADLKEQQSLKTGGKSVKGLAAVARVPFNIGVKVANAGIGVANIGIAVANSRKSEDKKIGYYDKFDKKDKADLMRFVPKRVRNATGSIDNYLGKARKEAKSIIGDPKSNPKNNLRKFNRKFTRMMAEKMKDENAKPELQQKFGLGDLESRRISLKIQKDDSNLNKVRKMLAKPFFNKIKEDDSHSQVAGKVIGKVVTTPLMPITYVASKVYKSYRRRRDKDQYQDFHKNAERKAYDNLKDEKLKSFDKSLDSEIIRAKNLPNKISYQDLSARLQALKEKPEHAKSVNEINKLLEYIQKDVAKKDNDVFDVAKKSINGFFVTLTENKEEHKKAKEKQRMERLKRLQDLEIIERTETLYERLSRIDNIRKMEGQAQSDLAKRYQEFLNDKIDDKIKANINEKDENKRNQEITKLDKLKNALTINISDPEFDDIRQEAFEAFHDALDKNKKPKGNKTLIALNNANTIGDLIYEGYEKVARFKIGIADYSGQDGFVRDS